MVEQKEKQTPHRQADHSSDLRCQETISCWGHGPTNHHWPHGGQISTHLSTNSTGLYFSYHLLC